ncbi:hypothetical protein C447_00135 [Halococcus hamelinensis 100A6]|uniref:Uncharacterized protein n=1 Tax=Halococcus hamelinensis 100A6 TaxID=1132509 RepID=M0M891_9EURY|nr:hypothetical protein C447_00135 [Halococcus hamelinensis 100A6]
MSRIRIGAIGSPSFVEYCGVTEIKINDTAITEVVQFTWLGLDPLNTGIAFTDRDQVRIVGELGEVLAIVYRVFFEFEGEDCFELRGRVTVGGVVLQGVRGAGDNVCPFD